MVKKTLLKKFLILKSPQRPKSNFESLKNDTYSIYAQGLLAAGAIDQAEIIYLSPKLTNQSIQIKKGITIHFFKNPAAAAKIIQQPWELVLVRGNYSQWQPLLKKISAEIKMFYAADSDFWPRFWNPKEIDIVFVDEKKYGRELKRKYPWLTAPILEKAVNEKIFKPKKTAKKFDLCYVAGFLPWKNHNQLFSQIAKLPEPWKIKTVLVGNTFNRERIAWVLSWKYKVWFKWTGSLGSRKVADYLRQSKFSVFPGELDANPRALTESLACGIPVLINSDITGGRHLINSKTGISRPLHQFHQGISWLKKHYRNFSPELFFQKNLRLEKIISESFLKPIEQVKAKKNNQTKKND